MEVGRKPGKTPFSFKDYYQKNKEEISQKRKDKYRKDPRRRKRMIQVATKYYHDKKKRPDIVVDRRMIVDESGQRFLSIGRVSRLIGRKISSIRRYHFDNIIPEPLFYDARGWRLYTVHQAQLMQRAFRRFDDPNDKEVTRLAHVSEILKEGWEGDTDGKESNTATGGP